MRKATMILAATIFWSAPLAAQQTCVNYPVIVNSPEDKLMLAVNGAGNPQEQVTALTAFTQQHANSKFIPCAYEYLTRAYVKLRQYNQAIAAGGKAVAAGHHGINFEESLLHAYMGAGQASDPAFQLIFNAPAEIKTQNVPAKPLGISDADWAKLQGGAAKNAQNETQYMVYAFFQLLGRVADPKTRISVLDQFSKAYPEAAQQQAGMINSEYIAAYGALNETSQVDEFAEKAVAANPRDVEALNILAFDYSIQRRTKWSEAEADARKVIELVPSMQKPAGMTDDQFKAEQDKLLGMAHLSLGYALLYRASSGSRYATHAQMAPAISALEGAIDPLASNPALQGGAYFYLANAYEHEYPAEHHAALEALDKAAGLSGPWQSSARDLRARILRVAH